jgi:hypothetical protein
VEKLRNYAHHAQGNYAHHAQGNYAHHAQGNYAHHAQGNYAVMKIPIHRIFRYLECQQAVILLTSSTALQNHVTVNDLVPLLHKSTQHEVVYGSLHRTTRVVYYDLINGFFNGSLWEKINNEQIILKLIELWRKQQEKSGQLHPFVFPQWEYCLLLSSHFGYANIVRHLFQAFDLAYSGAEWCNIADDKRKSCFTPLGHSMWQAVHLACKNGHVAIVEILLKNGADVRSNCRLLYLAISSGNADTVLLLLENEAKIPYGAVHSAFVQENEVILDILLKKAVPWFIYSTDLLLKASHRGKVKLVETFLRNGYTADEKNVQLAAHHGHVKVLELLLKNSKDNEKLVEVARAHYFWDNKPDFLK